MSRKRTLDPGTYIVPRVLSLVLTFTLLIGVTRGMAQTTDEPSGSDVPAASVPAPSRGGGGAQADFDTLIDLIVATIAPDTWDDVGGDGSIQGFPGGVYVDSQGILRQLDRTTTDKLAPRWQQWNLQRQRVFGQQDVARRSALRKVSLLRLLAACPAKHAQPQPPDDAMLHLAGLERIDYLIYDKEAADWILAGPADAWKIDRNGRHVANHSGRPVLRLEDLVVLLSNAYFAKGQFLCAITPTQEGLVQAQQFIARSADRPVAVGRRDAWLQGFRSALGLQRIEVEGIDANTRVSRVIVEADHHMKRIGIGLEPGTDRVDSYLDLLSDSGRLPERMDVLRWWFTLHEQAVRADRPGQLYTFAPQAVQVLSENELLTRHGKRVQTGKSDPLNEQFARDFTEDFAEIARRYPIYADLDNLFRLALVAAIVHQHGSSDPSQIDLAKWLRAEEFVVTTGRAPQWVESVVNYREVNRRRFVAAVSGGVRFAAPALTSLPVTDPQAAPTWRPSQRPDTWWWD
jgi:hypothetical protein